MYVSNDSNDSINIGYLDRKPGNFREPFYRRIILLSMKSTDGLNENHVLHISLLKTGWKKKNNRKKSCRTRRHQAENRTKERSGHTEKKTCWDVRPFFSLSQPWPRKHVLCTPQVQNPKTTFDPNDSIVACHYTSTLSVHLY